MPFTGPPYQSYQKACGCTLIRAQVAAISSRYHVRQQRLKVMQDIRNEDAVQYASQVCVIGHVRPQVLCVLMQVRTLYSRQFSDLIANSPTRNPKSIIEVNRVRTVREKLS